MNKIGNSDYLLGYQNNKFISKIQNTPEQISAFIMKYGLAGDLKIIDIFDIPLISTFGIFIDKCCDKDYLLNYLQPALMSDTQIEFIPAAMSSIFPDKKLISNCIIENNYCNKKTYTVVTLSFDSEPNNYEVFSVDSMDFDSLEQLKKDFPNTLSKNEYMKLAKTKKYI